MRLDSVLSYGVYTAAREAKEAGMETLTISRLALLGGVNLETVRYYERRGLLPKPPRTQAGYRQFSPDAARRIRKQHRSVAAVGVAQADHLRHAQRRRAVLQFA